MNTKPIHLTYLQLDDVHSLLQIERRRIERAREISFRKAYYNRLCTLQKEANQLLREWKE